MPFDGNDDDDHTVVTAKSLDEASHSFNASAKETHTLMSTGQLL